MQKNDQSPPEPNWPGPATYQGALSAWRPQPSTKKHTHLTLSAGAAEHLVMSPLEHTSVPVLPDFPSDQNNEGIEALAAVIRRRLNSSTPPGG